MSSFAEANQAFEAAQSAKEQSATSESRVETTTEHAPAERSADSTPSVVDIDKLEKFMYEGKEWTKDDLRKSILMHQDYTKKTQEVASERKAIESERRFAENVPYDLEKLARDPTLISEFKRVYPEKYHATAEKILERLGVPKTQIDQTRANDYSAEVARLERVEQWMNTVETEKMQQHLDHTFDKLKTQFPEADELVVIAKAQAKRNQGEDIKDSDFEKWFKADHESRSKKLEDYYLGKIKDQKAANRKGRDVPAGGEAPGAPQKKMNFKEATAQAIKDLSNRS